MCEINASYVQARRFIDFHTLVLNSYFLITNFLWAFLFATIFEGDLTIFYCALFLTGLLIVNYVIFPKSRSLFVRNGEIEISENAILLRLAKKTFEFRRTEINDIHKGTFEILDVGILAIRFETEKRKYELYFEDINEQNRDFYESISEKIVEG